MKLQHVLLVLTGLVSVPVALADCLGCGPTTEVMPIDDMSVASITLSTVPQKCKVYTDCARCQPGYWRCCFSGCAGHLMPGSNTCSCIQDGKDLGASCGCT